MRKWLQRLFGIVAMGTLLSSTPINAQHEPTRPPRRLETERRSSESYGRHETAREREIVRETTREQEQRTRVTETRAEREWRRLDPVEKRHQAEAIGEAGMMKAARQLGYESALKPSESSKRPQGYDAVFRDPKTRELIVGEAKGGYNGRSIEGTLGNGYGHRQGTIGWAVAAAHEILRPESTANRKERAVAADILRAYEEKQLRVEVFHTEHRWGEPLETEVARTGKQRNESSRHERK